VRISEQSACAAVVTPASGLRPFQTPAYFARRYAHMRDAEHSNAKRMRI
jgi:hypothetical protein